MVPPHAPEAVPLNVNGELTLVISAVQLPDGVPVSIGLVVTKFAVKPPPESAIPLKVETEPAVF